MKIYLYLFSFCISLFFSTELLAQTVSNGSVTGSPAANSGINNGNAPSWSNCNFSPDLCDVGFPSYSGGSDVTPVASPDGGTWLGMASLEECAQTTITGLSVGNTYTLYFCGANFGTGTTIFYGGPAQPRITIGTTVQSFSIPQAASTWGGYSMSFTANTSSMTLQIEAPNVSGSYSNAGSFYASLDGFSLTPSITSCNVLLNVEWEKVTAIIHDNQKVDVTWALASEKNFDYYEIQRSTDGHFFTTIGEQLAFGTSLASTAYLFTDYQLPAVTLMDGGPLYYRIKQISEDGSHTYSAIAVVTVFPENKPTLALYPNPTNDILTVDVLSKVEENQQARLQLYAVTGQLVRNQVLQLNFGRTIQEINVQDLSAGTYFLRLTTAAGQSYQRKFIIDNE